MSEKSSMIGKRSSPEQDKEQGGKQGLKKVKHLWEDPAIMSQNAKKWAYLEHHGVLFPKEFESMGMEISYRGEKIKLNPQQEEIATYWCQAMGTDYETHPIYRKNVSFLFLSTFKDKQYNFDEFDFSAILKKFERNKEIKVAEREERKKWTKERKNQEKMKKLRKDEFYGYALIDGRREKMGGYVIEPPTLFRGRGEHPKNGFLKSRTYPEDITINIAQDAPVPRCNIPGRAWKDIVHNSEVTWLAFYRDEVINSSYKYIFLSSNSKFKAKSDMLKYEKARKLKNRITGIRDNYWKMIRSKSQYDRQIGVVTYLIDKLALRVGNEKNEEQEADTVGCCSLRFEHVVLEEDNQIHLKFLGKDSIEYENTIKVEPDVYKSLQGFLKGKKKGDDLFEKINPSRLNDYLQGLMKGLTAKVFRTYNASHTLDIELSHKLPKKLTLEEKARAYTDANKKVAVLCNHQKAVDKGFDERMAKYQDKIKDMEDYQKQLQKHIRLIHAGLPGLKTKDGKAPKGKVKRRFASTLKSSKAAMKKLNERIRKEREKLDEKLTTKNVSLGTSKINYNDPRITVAWCKRVDVPIDKIFSKELRGKFAWAMTAEPEWRF